MIVIYGAEWCSWCIKAKKLAEQYQLDFIYKDVDDIEVKQQLQEKLPDTKTIPQVFWHDRPIGGYEDFAREIENTLGYYGQERC